MHPFVPLFTVIALLANPSVRSPRITAADALADFDALWTFVEENYAYFDDKLTVWADVRKLYRPQVENVRTKNELISVLERALAELYDSHAHLNANTAASPPLIPSGTDLWAEWRDGKAIVVDVRPGSAAAAAGFRPLAEVRSIDGAPVADAIELHIGRSLRSVDDEVRSWALRVALAGRRGTPRTIRVSQEGREQSLDLGAVQTGVGDGALLRSGILPGNIGYISVVDSLGRGELIDSFDEVLSELKNTSGLILDLRNTPGGGNTTVARGILGRFVTRELPYQRHVLVSEERFNGVRRSWLEMVSPRGAFTYTRPVVVLVDHWTGSMGEGLAIGFDATGAGTVVGSEMAGLLGATYFFELPRSGIGANIPAERLSHVDGTPREDFRPEAYVGPGALDPEVDAILEAGLRTLRSKVLKTPD